MSLSVLRFLAVLFTAVAMAAGFAHLLELPNKMPLSREQYLTVQQIYRGWALLGIVVVGALVTTVMVAVRVRDRPLEFYLTLAAALCVALSLVVFFLFTYPANRQTQNWTTLPEKWETLRRQWEYSHAVAAGLYFVALSSLTASLLVGRD
jgi:mannose/fructose/N-acetylgalactosamine-specific phosphotransferase system component IID